MKILLIRPRGPHTTAHLGGCSVTETSLEHIQLKSSCLPSILTEKLGTVILEDLHKHDVPDSVWRTLRPAMDGVSCPVVTRWIYPDPNA